MPQADNSSRNDTTTEMPLSHFLERRAVHRPSGLTIEVDTDHLEARDFVEQLERDGLPALQRLLDAGDVQKGDNFDHFLGQEGRRFRRCIDIPDPAYGQGHAELSRLVDDIIQSRHRATIVAALGSMEVDLAYYEWVDRDGMGGTKASRQQQRLRRAMEQLAASISPGSFANELLHCAEIEPIRLAVKAAISELVTLAARKPGTLYEMSPRRFEELVAEILASFGWHVELTAESKDGGFDVFAVSDNTDNTGIRTSYVVECKRYSPTHKVGVAVARQLFHVKAEMGASQAIIATTSDFTRGVYDYKASRWDFDTRNFHEIVDWCKAYTERKSQKDRA